MGATMYALLDELVEAHHPELQDARIALAWCSSWNPDVDGRVTLGKCRKASDLDRELAQFDFVILLRRSFWRARGVTALQQRALLDHELCHAAVKLDKFLDPVEDERGRKVWRTRKHDIEEFACIVERYGMWTADLEAFASAMRRTAMKPFQPCEKCADDAPGWTRIQDDKWSLVVRCACWMQWLSIREEIRADEAVPA